MKAKRWMAAGLAAMLAMSMAACGNGGNASSSSETKTKSETGSESKSESKSAGKDVTITFATNVVGTKAEALQRACKDFEAETGYTVDFQAPGSSYEELMKTKMSANELPDVFTTHGWSVARYSDYLMPVNDLQIPFHKIQPV